MTKRLCGVLLAFALVAVALPAHAQTTRFDIQTFRPTPGPRDLIIVPQSQPLSHLSASVGGFLSFSLNPLALLNGDTKTLDVVKNRFELDVMAAIGLGGWFEFGAVLPVILLQQSDNLQAIGTEGYVAPTVLGDLSLFGKVPFLKRLPYAKGWGVAFSLRVNFPTGSQEAFASDGFYTFNPTLIADYRFGFGALISVQAGVNIRPQAEFFGFTTGPMFTVNAGGELPIVRRYGVTAVGGIYANVPLFQLPSSVTQIPAQALLGLRYYSSVGVTFTTGLSFGGDCTIKVPSISFFLAAVWVPAKTREYAAIESFKQPPIDPDGDGLIGEADWCPNEKGPVENHGCPIRDYDKDGIPDQYDECPELAGLKQYNGCPRVFKSENKIKVMERVNFATDQDIILPESFSILQDVAEIIGAHKEWQEILIEGHCDTRASDAYNLDLSQRRADSVMRFLLKHGIEGSRLQAEGFGRSRPLPGVDGTTEAGMALNRRVEFTILKVAPGAAPLSLTPTQVPIKVPAQASGQAPATTPAQTPAQVPATPSAGGATPAGSLGGH